MYFILNYFTFKNLENTGRDFLECTAIVSEIALRTHKNGSHAIKKISSQRRQCLVDWETAYCVSDKGLIIKSTRPHNPICKKAKTVLKGKITSA